MSAYTFDDIEHAYTTGYDAGMLARVEVEAEQRAHELIHARSVEMLGLARRSAAEKGPAWAALIEQQAAEPWQGVS